MNGERQPTLATAVALLRLLGSEQTEAALVKGDETRGWPADMSPL